MSGMRNDPTRGRRLKQQLPYPYNQDLSKVLRGLKRRNPISRRSRQANDPVTAAYLAAAVRLIQRHLGPGASRLPGDADDADSIERPLLGFLSQRAVAAEVSHNPPPFHRVGRVSTMRERWRHQSDFVADPQVSRPSPRRHLAGAVLAHRFPAGRITRWFLRAFTISSRPAQAWPER